MALFRKLFYRKPPDGLVEIGGDRVYVFNRCFTTEVWEEKNYKGYVAGIIRQLREHYPDVSILAFNFREGESQSLIEKDLSEHDVTIIDYPRHYEGCPLLSMEMIIHFLRSSESWLSLGQQNVLLVHCEWGGWPVLAFMLAALLIYRQHFTGEQKTLDMIYKQAPHELLYLMQPVNPIPSQLRYLQYLARRNLHRQWPPLDRALTLDCIIIRMIPNFDGEDGCRPIFRIYGKDPLVVSDPFPKKLFSTSNKSNAVRYYKQAECELIKIDINCHIQGDVVLECISLHDDREKMMFQTMFNTSFIESNILILNGDEIDTLWDAKDQFPKDFRAEVLFSDMDAAASVVPDDLSCFEKKDGLPVEAFANIRKIINSANWLNQKGDASSSILPQITGSNLIQEKLESLAQIIATSKLIDQASLEKPQESQEPAALENNAKGLTQSTLEEQVGSSSEVYRSNKQEAVEQLVETKESSASVTSAPVSPHERKTVEHPSLHGQECGKLKEVSSLPEIEERPLMTNVLTSPSPPPLPTKDQGTVSGNCLSPAPTPPALLTPLKDKLEVHSPPQPTPTRDQSSNTIYLKDDTTLVSQPDTSLLPLEMPLTPCRNKIIAERKPALPSFPSGISSPSGPIPNDTHLEEKLVSKRGMSPSSPPPPPPPPPLSLPAPTSSPFLLVTTPRLNNICSSISGPPQPPAPLSPPLKEKLVSKGGILPPPPPPPPIPPLKERLVSEGGMLPPPPPPPPSPPPPPTPPLKERLVSKGGMLPSTPPPPPPPPPIPPLKERLVSEGGMLPPPPPPPPTPPLKERLVSKGGMLPPPPPPPPPLPPISPLKERLVSEGGMLPPPPPPPPTPTLKESLVSKGGMLPPPPPLLPEQLMKENSSLTGAPCPPPPPPLLSSQASKPTDLYAVPLAPPPPSSVSALKDNNNLPKSVPPPPVPFPKMNNLPASPSPIPPIAPPPNKNYRRVLSTTMTSRSNSMKKLKPLHWLKISRAVQGSFWAEIEKCSYASKSSVIDMPELVYFFSVQNLDQVGSGRNGNSRTKFGQKLQKVQLIDHRRAYNCEIMLSKVKIPLHDMLTSVLALEDSALDIDQLENLIKFCPTKEEIELLKGYKGEKEKLGRCEQFMLELMQVPRIESKLRVFSFTIQFQSRISELRNNLNIVNSATDQIRGSSKLKGVLQTILHLGNALNQGTARGSAAGFKLDSLLKLTDTRSWSNKMTLMHYLCKILTEKLPELLDFSKDLSSLEPALKIQLKFLAEEMQAISKGMEKVVHELSMSENDGLMSENFCKALKEFLSYAEGDVSSLAQLFSDVGKNVDSLIIYFGEDPARCPFEQVVSTLMSFQRMFNQALEENRKQLEFERKKSEKEAKEKERTSASDHKKT